MSLITKAPKVDAPDASRAAMRGDPTAPGFGQPAPVFKPGDVVWLKSGGPAMTIELIDGESVRTTWFDVGEACDANFVLAALVHDNPVR